MKNTVTEESRTKADSSTHVMDAHELALSSNGLSRLTEDILDEQSNPGIVMEQEELSDSDEDVGDVEFECEEMADSEGEGLGYRELDNLQNKVNLSQFSLSSFLKEAW